MSPAGTPPGPKIVDLQLLRGAAILLVLVEHAPLTPAVLGLLPHPVACPGWLGVDLFFVISGYVIALSLARDRFEPVAFFVRRVFRLTPALLLLVGLTGVLTAVLGDGPGPGGDRAVWVPARGEFWPLAASVVGGYYTLGPPEGKALLGVAWSLSVEDQFYAVVTVVSLLGAVALRRRAPRVVPVVLLGLAAGMYVLAVAMRLEYLARGSIKLTAWRPFVYLFFLRFDFLALGVVLGLAGRRLRGPAAGRGAFWVPILLGVPLVLSAVCGHTAVLSRPVFGLVLPVAGWCFGLLVVLAGRGAAFPGAHGPAARGWKYLGDRSYTIYLFHGPAMLAAWAVLGAAGGAWVFGSPVRAGLLHAAVTAAVLLPLVEVIYRGVELPLTAVGRRLSHRLRVVPADPLPDAPPGTLPFRSAA